MQHGIDQDAEKGEFFYVKAMINAIKTEQSVYQVTYICIICL